METKTTQTGYYKVAEDSFSFYTKVSDTLSVMVTTVTVLCVMYTLRQKKELYHSRTKLNGRPFYM